MKFTAREIFGIFLVLIIGLLSLTAWQVFFAAMMTPGLSDIWWPIFWFSLLATGFFLGAVAWDSWFLRIAAAALIFFPGLFFMRAWEYAIAGVVALACIFLGARDIALEREERLHFHFFKSVRAGTFLFVVGLSLLLSSGYYVFLKNASWEELVPRFRIGEEMTSIIFKAAGTLNPSFATLSQGDATVDEFLLSLEKNSPEAPLLSQPKQALNPEEQSIFGAFPEISRYLEEQGIRLVADPDRERAAQELFLQSGREQIAALVGRPVQGGEKISDVLSLALQRKLIALLSGGEAAEHVPSQAIPFFLSLLLFFTFLSFASMLSLACIAVAQGIFLFSLWMGWLTLSKITVEQEKLAK